MNKKLLALAVGAALGTAPMMASAGVKVYGQAQVEIASEDAGTASSQTTVEDNARGRMGVKASEKLGNGMTAIAKFEWKIDTTEGGRDTGQRESFVGLKGGFGTLQLGNLKSGYKYTGGVKYDPFVATNLEARGTGGMSKGELGNGSFGHNSFMNNAIGYMSPKMGALSAWVTYSPDEAGTSKGSDGDYTLGVKYKAKNFEVFVAAVNNDDAAGGDGVKFGGQFKMGMHKISAQVENLSGNTGNTAIGNVDADLWFVGYQGKFGNNILVAQFGNRDVDGAANDTDYYALGVIHKMSKQTRVFAGFRSTDGGTSATETDVFSIGMRKDF
jgi:predicted porin